MKAQLVWLNGEVTEREVEPFLGTLPPSGILVPELAGILLMGNHPSRYFEREEWDGTEPVVYREVEE